MRVVKLIRERLAPNSSASSITQCRATLLFLVALIILSGAAYAPALNGTVLWDDQAHLTAKQLQSSEGLRRIWTDLGATQQYYPLLHSAFWLEHALWGDSMLGYHLVNVVLHGLAACLFGVLLARLCIPGAWLAAAIFASHPVHAESVAWISEQKNTLSLCLYLGAAILYFRFREARNAPRYLCASCVFLLGLLTKSVTATLPGALLVLVWWQNGRLEWRRDVAPLLPWLAIGACAGLFTAWVERKFIGAEGAEFEFSILQRLLLSGHVVWFYLGKLFWPANLTFIYPRWEISPHDVARWIPLLGLITLAALLWWKRKHSRAPLAVLLLFVGSLFPVLGFLNVYPFRYSFVADHFQYVASLSVIGCGSAGVARGFASGSARMLIAAGLAGALAILSFSQSFQYRSAEALWRTTITRNPHASMAWVHLGELLTRAGRYAAAVACFRRAAEVNTLNWDAYNNLGAVYIATGRVDEALNEFQRALAINPQSAEAHSNLSDALRRLGRLPEAITQAQKALKHRPTYSDALNNLGVALLDAGRPEESLVYLRRAVRQDPDDAELRHNAGNALRRLGRWSEAVAYYREALRLNSELAETHNELGIALAAAEQIEEAIASQRRALELKPGFVRAHYGLGLLLAQTDRLDEALGHLHKAVELEPNDAAAHRERGIVLAKLRRWTDAVDAFGRVVRIQPQSAPDHRNYAMALANAGATSAALTSLRHALQIEPNSPETHEALHLLLRAMGRPDDAEQHRRRAQEINATR